MIEQITVNPINESLFSADFIKGFRCGAKRQFQADVEEIAKAKFGRPTGEWIQIDPIGEFECSQCGWTMIGTSKFCPDCGAKMGGDDSE